MPGFEIPKGVIRVTKHIVVPDAFGRRLELADKTRRRLRLGDKETKPLHYFPNLHSTHIKLLQPWELWIRLDGAAVTDQRTFKAAMAYFASPHMAEVTRASGYLSTPTRPTRAARVVTIDLQISGRPFVAMVGSIAGGKWGHQLYKVNPHVVGLKSSVAEIGGLRSEVDMGTWEQMALPFAI